MSSVICKSATLKAALGVRHQPNTRCIVKSEAKKGDRDSFQVLSGSQRTKLDRRDDRTFYSTERLVFHADDNFRRQLCQLYRQRLPDGDIVVLDLMSSWVSHLPPEKVYKRVIGHGMNAKELEKNKQLDEWFIRDLNKQPDGWAIGDETIDAVLCCCSVQYLEQPEEVMHEVYRVLRPGGVLIISFSNRMFYEKAVAAWRDNTEYGRVQLAKSYLSTVKGFTSPEVVREVSNIRRSAFDSVISFLQNGSSKDPFYAVICYKGFTPMK